MTMNETSQQHAFATEWEKRDFSQTIRPALHFAEEGCQILEGSFKGHPLRWAGDKFDFRPCEVTLWCGVNGQGKSLLTGQVAQQLMAEKHRILIMSFEMTPARTMVRMARQALGQTPDIDRFEAWCRWANSTLLFFDQQGAVTAEDVLGAILFAIKKYRVEHIFVDNLMKVVSGEDDYNGQKLFVQYVTDIAREQKVHIHVVHHARKGSKETDEIDKFSVRGSASIVDQVDNLCLIERNLKKEKQREAGTLAPTDDQTIPDSFLRVAKQRNGDWQGTINLWFNPSATAFSTDPTRKVEQVSPLTPIQKVTK